MKNFCSSILSFRAINIKGLLILSFLLFKATDSVSQDLNTYNYFVGTGEPDSAWNAKDYNDSFWTPGQGSIGYGDNDDSLVIDTTASVYLRYKLDLPKTFLNHKYPIVFRFDFDDGFIAYLNGNEILRVNMNDSILKPDHLHTTCRSHEAENYRLLSSSPQIPRAFRPIQGYYIDTATLAKCNLDTSNVFAVEVHNDSIKGSDLSFSPSYEIIDNTFNYNLYWENCRFTAPVKLDSTKLPIIKIETIEYGCNLEDTIAFMGIINNGTGKYNKLSDPYTDYKGRIRMKLHGQTSKDFPKKTFKIELQDSAGNNLDASLMGMPKDNDWILYGPFVEKSLLRNEFVFSLGRRMGHYEPRTKFCELIMNGRDVGLYILTEQIKRGKNRVNVDKLDSTMNSGINLTGGYLFRFDKDVYENIEILYPNTDNITPEQNSYIHGFYNTSQTVLLSDNFRDPVNGYRKYIDDKSLADNFIINELTMNIDAFYYSCYMYKGRDDIDGRIKYGPLWDYDFSMGYSVWNDIETSGWQYKKREMLNLARILQDSTFAKLISSRWNSLRKGILGTDSINKYINAMVDNLELYITRNYQIWPIIQYDYFFAHANEGKSYAEEIEKWQTWLETRITWMDANIDNLYIPTDLPVIYSDNEKEKIYLFCYPNPFMKNLNLALNIASPGAYKIAIFDLTGKKLVEYNEGIMNKGVFETELKLSQNLNRGVFIITVYRNNMPLVSRKIVKI